MTTERTSLPTFGDIEDAAARLKGMAVETPMIRNDALDAATDARVWVKAEVLQRTGSFKFRGAYNRISRLNAGERDAGVVAFSSGNHAQGVALAAQIVGCPAVIIMPSDAPALKIEATRGYGAEVILYDRHTEDREALGRGVAAERGAILVPPYEDFFVIAGQGTAGREAALQLAERGERADMVVPPASGGGLLGGTALSFEALSPTTVVWVAEPEGHDDHRRSLMAGERVRNAGGSSQLCDALMSPEPGELTFALNRTRVAGGVGVSDAEVFAAMRFAFRHLKLVMEPSGAVPLAALLAGKLPAAGKTVVLIASGGNVDPALFAQALAV